jgi:hypothetical protein
MRATTPLPRQWLLITETRFRPWLTRLLRARPSTDLSSRRLTLRTGKRSFTFALWFFGWR